MEFVAANMRTQEFHQRASNLETEACKTVMNEVRSARASFENAEAGRVGELAQRSHMLETELVIANNQVHSLTTEFQAQLAAAAAAPSVTRQRDAFEGTLAAVRAEYADESRGFAARFNELRQDYAARLAPLEGQEAVVAETLAQRESQLEASALIRKGLHEQVECERGSVRALLAELRTELTQNRELVGESRGLQEDELLASEELEKSREEVGVLESCKGPCPQVPGRVSQNKNTTHETTHNNILANIYHLY